MFWKWFRRFFKPKPETAAQFLARFGRNKVYKYIQKRYLFRRCVMCGFPSNTYLGEIALCTYHEGHDEQGNLLVVW